MWKCLDEVVKVYNVNWYWVKGYFGYFENEWCDILVCIVVELKFIIFDEGFVGV